MKIQKRGIRRFSLKTRIVASSLAVIVLATGGFLEYHRFFPAPPQSVVSNTQPKSAKNEPDDTKKPSEEKLDRSIPSTHPRRLIIDSLGINAAVLSMGILDDGSLEAPKTAWNVGWYDQSALPGSGSNALLIDGHVNDALNTPGVFYKIDTLKPGDIIKIQRGDKKTFTYSVVNVEQKPLEKVDMANMLRSVTPGKEGLNLITCGGTYDYGRETYTDRVLVFSELVS